MDTTTSSLFWIVLCSVLAPLLAGLVPGMAIDPAAVAARPGVLAVFVALILVVRGCLVFASERAHGRRTEPALRPPAIEPVAVALYAATGLPIIVAVTSSAVSAGQMSPQTHPCSSRVARSPRRPALWPRRSC